ncbi:lycopene beta-cyclase CrtY [Sphingomonas sp. IW22]|uniref:lycopene beta-cyclase CrtY n=1 Tax=Sphingomonas sp. IW22 TaxID=3242489 RepID=UPI0035221E6E
MPSTHRCNVAIVGAGLAGGLIALALAQKHPDLDLRLIDAGETVGGNHLWSFFESDVAAQDRWLVEPLICHRWTGYDVAFPAHRRTLAAHYRSIESERLDRVVRERLPDGALMLGRRVLAASATAVVLGDGERIEADGVIDCRGAADLSMLSMGWQKFVGQELVLDAPHGAPRPMVMDAGVEQIDGYRFVYCLPFAADRMFVEDTYYSDTPDIDDGALTGRIAAYADARGWPVARVARVERGALPVVWAGDFEGYWTSGGRGVAKAGVRAGLFHPLTGYSLPDAVRTAALIARARDFSGAALHQLTHGHAAATWKARGFYRALTAMLFRAAEPGERWRVLERFYRLDPALIGRFYSGQSTILDKARVLAGKPPVPVGRAIAAIREIKA